MKHCRSLHSSLRARLAQQHSCLPVKALSMLKWPQIYYAPIVFSRPVWLPWRKFYPSVIIHPRGLCERNFSKARRKPAWLWHSIPNPAVPPCKSPLSMFWSLGVWSQLLSSAIRVVKLQLLMLAARFLLPMQSRSPTIAVSFQKMSRLTEGWPQSASPAVKSGHI
ncbi:hypothetical protein M3J09_006129 [Ascochyta lentis]